MKDQVKPTTEDVLADILKVEQNQADIDALIECRTAYGVSERILHRGIDIANDLDLVAIMLIKLGQLESAKEVNAIATQARNTAQFTLPGVCRKVSDAINKKASRLHPDLPTSKAKQGTPIL